MQRHLLMGAFAPCILLSLSGCASLGLNKPGRTPSHISQPNAALTGEDVADVRVSRLNALRWADIAGDLQTLTQFDFKSQDLLSSAVTTTSSSNSAYSDTLRATIAAAVSGASITKTETNSVDAEGVATSTYDRTRSFTTPAAPGAMTFNIQAPALTTSGAAGSATGVEAHFKYQAAKSLAEEVVILNRQIGSMASQSGYRPYFVSLKLSIQPMARGYPYDTTLKLKLSLDGTDSSLPIIPLLMTDAVESVQDTEVSDVIRQLGASIKASAGSAALGADLERTLSQLQQDAALRPNSLFTLGASPNELRIRLGANQFGRYYEMVPRTYNISFVVLAPAKSVEQIADPDKRYNPPSNQRTLNITGDAEFRDATARNAIQDGKPEPLPPSLKTKVTSDSIELPAYRALTCPPAQTAIISSEESFGKPATLVLQGGESLGYRNIEATLVTDKVRVGGLNHSMTFISRNVQMNAANLTFVFPNFVAATNDEDNKIAHYSKLTFEVYDLDDGFSGIKKCDRGYQAVYIPKGASKKGAQGANSSDPSSATPSNVKVSVELNGVAASVKGGSAQSGSNSANTSSTKNSKPSPGTAAGSDVITTAPAAASDAAPPPPPPPPAPN